MRFQSEYDLERCSLTNKAIFQGLKGFRKDKNKLKKKNKGAHPLFFPQLQLPVPDTAPHVAKPQLLSALHFPPQEEQLVVFAISVVLASLFVRAIILNVPAISKKVIIVAIIHIFIWTPP